MFGCLGRLGCLALILIIGVAAWFSRSTWMPAVGLEAPRAESTSEVAEASFTPVSESAAERGRRAVASLSSQRGYVTLDGAEAASYLASRFVERIPPSAERVEAAVVGNRLELRAEVPLDGLGSAESLGPLRQMLGGREDVHVTGTLRMLRPGLAEYRVQRMRVRDFNVPSAAIPLLLREVWRGERPEGLSADGLGVGMPDDVGEVRIENGKVIIYRTVR